MLTDEILGSFLFYIAVLLITAPGGVTSRLTPYPSCFSQLTMVAEDNSYDEALDWMEQYWGVKIEPSERFQVEILLTSILPKRYPDYNTTDLLDLFEACVSRKGRKFVEQPFTSKRMESILTREIKQKQATEKRLRTLERKLLKEELMTASYMIETTEVHRWILQGLPEAPTNNTSDTKDRIFIKPRSN